MEVNIHTGSLSALLVKWTLMIKQGISDKHH